MRCHSSYGNLKLARSQHVSPVAPGQPAGEKKKTTHSHWLAIDVTATLTHSSALVEVSTDVGHTGMLSRLRAFVGPVALRWYAVSPNETHVFGHVPYTGSEPTAIKGSLSL